MEIELTEKSLRGKFPFRLGTTSFIYPDLYSENVRRLGPFFDEIELLFFESNHPDALPDTYEIELLLQLKNEYDIEYNVHLPTDISLAAQNPVERKRAASVYADVIWLTSVLEPVSYTLHIPFVKYPGGTTVWQAYAMKGLSLLLEHDIDPSLVSVETLDYSPDLLECFLDRFDISLCLDIGHLLLYGYDPLDYFEKFSERIEVIHLHGSKNGSDHLALDVLDEKVVADLKKIFGIFKGSLSIEVFSINDLKRSLDMFEKSFNPDII